MARRKTVDIQLSEEQNKFIDVALRGSNILVDACIGSGKTTTIQNLCNVIPKEKNILYLTYNKLLKVDAKSKIRNKNATVTNYHGFAFSCLIKVGIKPGISDLIQSFNSVHPPMKHYDILIIDEYQDIEQELAEMLEYIKEVNRGIQLIAVGDMEQKIYDKTSLYVPDFIDNFLGQYERLEFTQCFRLSKELAAKLGRIWNKTIIGVNKDCKVEEMSLKEVIKFLSTQSPEDILCLGARTGDMAKALNALESDYSDRFNKKTVFASIRDNDSSGMIEPSKKAAIFTTYDSSKGLERKICVIFDFTENYWYTRLDKPQQSYKILRNIFCVAASRGKNHIIFVRGYDTPLTEVTLSRDTGDSAKIDSMAISTMFDFKFKEDVEACYKVLDIKEIEQEDKSIIDVPENDELIDLSPCIGIYQEALFFKDYSIDTAIEQYLSMNPDQQFLYTDKVKEESLDYKILFLTSLETHQDRYRKQVKIPFISDEVKKAITDRLSAVFSPNEEVQTQCAIHFGYEDSHFSVVGRTDVIKDGVIYELKFVNQLKHEHFLQLACYLVALKKDYGILWNVKNNTMYKVSVQDRHYFLDKVVKAITKRAVDHYMKPEFDVWGIRPAGMIFRAFSAYVSENLDVTRIEDDDKDFYDDFEN